MMDSMSLWKRICLSRGSGLPAGALAAMACLALFATSALSAPTRGRAAKTISVSDTGRLHLANPNSAGETLIEEGKATGTLPGSVRASLTIGTSKVRVAFTIYLHDGTITGHGTASFNPGKGEYASFGGSISVSRGSGRYAHASGTGRVYGSINRNTDNATVQVIGQLHI
jgi:hypothetical protein